jgi:hypothetical protein
VRVSKSGQQTIRRGRAANHRTGRRLGAAGHDLAEKVAPSPEVLSHVHDVVADAVKGSSESSIHAVQGAASFVSDAARQLEPLTRNGSHRAVDVIVPYLASGAERTTEALTKLREHVPTD